MNKLSERARVALLRYNELILEGNGPDQACLILNKEGFKTRNGKLYSKGNIRSIASYSGFKLSKFTIRYYILCVNGQFTDGE